MERRGDWGGGRCRPDKERAKSGEQREREGRRGGVRGGRGRDKRERKL